MSINQTMNQATKQLTCQSFIQSINQSINPLTSLQSIDPESINQETKQTYLPINLYSNQQSINRELMQPRRRRQQNPHKFAYLTMKNSIFARFACAFFIFWHFARTFSFFLRREMTCFAVEWTTWAYDDKCSILSSYVRHAGYHLIPGELEHILQVQWLWITAKSLKKRETKELNNRK